MNEMANDMYGKQHEGAGMEDCIKFRGCIEAVLYDAKTGAEVARRKINNTVVTTGRSYVLSRLVSASPQTDVINAIAVGTSVTAPTTGDTLLNSEVGSANSGRLQIASFVTTGLASNPPSWQAQVTFATNQAMEEMAQLLGIAA